MKQIYIERIGEKTAKESVLKQPHYNCMKTTFILSSSKIIATVRKPATTYFCCLTVYHFLKSSVHHKKCDFYRKVVFTRSKL